MSEPTLEKKNPLVNDLPPLPRLVLRVGFAGSQAVTAEAPLVAERLDQILEALALRVAQIAPGTPFESAAREPWISRFYSNENPVLRLITGLCEGADVLGAQALERLERHEHLSPHVATELAAVLPFDLPVYRASRTPAYRAEFDRQAARCAYIVPLDGIYEKPTPDTPLARNRRARAYRAQSMLLLRQADILVAAADPDAEGKAGGTLETVRGALDFDLPVIFLHTGTGNISVIEPGDDPASALAALAEGEGDWMQTVSGWVTAIVADPDAGAAPEHAGEGHGGHETVGSHGEKLLEEYFKAAKLPPRRLGAGGAGERKPSLGERFWTFFEGRFRSGRGPAADPLLAPYDRWRKRSTLLNHHYGGLYRGAFLLNYALAATAVLLAALSLVLLGLAPPHSPKTGHAEEKAPAPHTAAGETVHAVVAEATGWAFPTLLVLGAVKLGIVWWILRNTERANDGDWNDKAVDYRYLAERLRTMFYLPRLGSFQPPMAAPPQYASRVVRQSAVDWLLDAIVRSTPPAALAATRRETFTFPERSYEATVLRLDPLQVLADVRDRWIVEQTVYHDRNARTMDRIHLWAEHLGKVFNVTVIAIVAVDVAVILAEPFKKELPRSWEPTLTGLHHNAAWLVFLAAFLPAAVASLNGIRYQSECRRLAERSAVMRAILGGRARPAAAHAPHGFWQKLLARLWHRPIAFIGTLLPFAAAPKTSPAPDPSGSKLAAADRLRARIVAAQADPTHDLGAWTPEVLRFAESTAAVFVQEVAEWSVLYAKEVPEP